MADEGQVSVSGWPRAWARVVGVLCRRLKKIISIFFFFSITTEGVNIQQISSPQYCLLITLGGHRRSVAMYLLHHDSTRW